MMIVVTSKQDARRLVWKIDGMDYKTREKLPTLYIEADSFDKAIAKARESHPNYDEGQLVEKK